MLRGVRASFTAPRPGPAGRGRADRDTWSVSAGLDYPAVGPEHAHLKDIGRADYVGCEDDEALDAFALLAR